MKTFKQFISHLYENAGHWITINAPKDKKKNPDKHGNHVFISANGEVLAGASGALTGKRLTKVKSKSKEVQPSGLELKDKAKKENEVWKYSDTNSHEKKLKDFEQAKKENIGNHFFSDDINQKLWRAQLQIESEIRKWQRFLATPDINNPEKEEETKLNITAAESILDSYKEQRKYWKQRFADEISAAADAASTTAETTLEHKHAADLHNRAWLAQQAIDTKYLSEKARYHDEKAKEHEKKFKSLKRKEKLSATIAKKKEEKEREAKGELFPHERFFPMSIEEIKQHFLTQHGLAVADTSFTATDDYRKKQDDYAAINADKTASQEEKAAAKAAMDKAFNEIWRKRATKTQGFHPVDMSKTSDPRVKGIKHLLTFIDSSLTELKNRGFDIDTILKNQKLKYACGNITGRPAGLAWGREWSLSLKILDKYKISNIRKNEERRASAGLALWSVSSTAETQEEFAQLIMIHELSHAIGISQRSPERLDVILRKMYPNFQERKAWIKANISEYGATNIHETDAELCSKILHKNYVPGTLPKELEDHVYQLFNKK